MGSADAGKKWIKNIHAGRCQSDLIILDINNNRYYCVPEFFCATSLAQADAINILHKSLRIDKNHRNFDSCIDQLRLTEAKDLGEAFNPRWQISTYSSPKSLSMRMASIFVVTSTSLLLKIFGFRGIRLSMMAASCTRIFRCTLSRWSPSDLTNAVNWAYRFDLSGNQCLSNSLAVKIMLDTSGHSASLIVGARTRPFRSHAWVVSDGKIMNEDENIESSLVMMATFR